MIITDKMLKEKVPKDMIPTRLDSALNLYTVCCRANGEPGIILYNVQPETWNTLYSFYELNHKFTIDEYKFKNSDLTYGELIDEYKRKYKEEYENKMGYTKDKRIQILKSEFLKTFNLSDVTIKDELEPIFELKYSKSKGVYTLYYFENYVAYSVDKLADLIKQKLYDQKIMPLDSSITNIDGIDVVSNITYMLKSKENIEVLNNNVLYIDK